MKRSSLERTSSLRRSRLRAVGKRGAELGLQLKKARGKRKKWLYRRLAIFRERGEACERCGAKKSLDLHHVRRRSQGGSDKAHNLKILCRNCHDMVHAHSCEDWRDWLEVGGSNHG